MNKLDKNTVICIVGPTASRKDKLGCRNFEKT